MQDDRVNALLIEDNPDDAELLQAALAEVANASFNLEWVERLSTALERIEEGGIDVVLLDLSLPDSTGLETFTRAHAQAPTVPFVVLTGLDDEAVAVAALQAGAQDYLVKGQAEGALLMRSIHYAIQRKWAEQALQESEEQARRLAHESSVMAEIGRIISSSLDIDEVYGVFAAQVQELIYFDRVDVTLAESDREVATQAYWAGIEVPGRRRGDEYGLEGTMTETMVKTHSGILFHPQGEDQVVQRFPGLLPAFESGLRSWVGAPLVSRHSVIGGLVLATTRSNAYLDRDLALTQRVGSEIAGAIANAQLYAELREAQETVREVAVLEERNRMAREIHDTMAQAFTGIVLQMEAAEQVFDKAPVEVPDHLDRAKSLAREGLAEARRSVWNLLPAALEERTLTEALDEMVHEFDSVGRETARFNVSGDRRELPKDIQTTLLRICQESLTNARKHAQATEITVTLAFKADTVSLKIQDDGVGLDPEKTVDTQGGFGLIGMTQRALLNEGQLQIRSEKGGGTEIEVVVPIPSGNRSRTNEQGIDPWLPSGRAQG